MVSRGAKYHKGTTRQPVATRRLFAGRAFMLLPRTELTLGARGPTPLVSGATMLMLHRIAESTIVHGPLRDFTAFSPYCEPKRS